MVIFIEDDERGLVDISTDRAVIWTRNVEGQDLLADLRGGRRMEDHIEIYLEGHVVIRQADIRGAQAGQTRTLYADRVYYDVARNVALLVNGEIITQQPHLPVPVYLRAAEIRQVAPNRFETLDAEFSASRLPADPVLTVDTAVGTVEQREVELRGLFGRPILDPRTGAPMTETQLWGTAQPLTLEVENVPIFYLPRAAGDLRDPLGPLDRIRFRNDRIFGFGVMVDWDVFELLGAQAPPGTNWLLITDYFTDRGPALGSDFETRGLDLFGLPGPYHTLVRAYGIRDDGRDDLGGGRVFDPPKESRGRFLFRHRQEVGPHGTVLAQVHAISDRNFLEQYFKREFDEEFTQETFLYGKYQAENYAASLSVEPRLLSWHTDTEWFPRADAYWLGEPVFGSFTYFLHANAGYAIYRPTSDIPRGYVETPIPFEFDRVHPLPPSSDFPHSGRVETGRFDLWQELDYPLAVGPLKIVPYGLFDVTHYTETLTEDAVTRLYGGGGVRASIPFSRTYAGIHSQLFNVNGIAHKIVLESDYRYVRSSESFRELPELDQINDNATDQALRDFRAIRQAFFVPGSRQHRIGTSPLYDPQLYAIRRLLEYHPDTLDDIQVLRLGARQRWQTRRGFPGNQHLVDWMALYTGLSLFPQADRDNFGHTLAFLEFDYSWHIGDRTSLLSSGWLDPYEGGARVFNIGLALDRPGRSSFYLGYRTIDPLGSDVVLASSTYTFSPKWAATVVSSYDFGEAESLGNALILTRIGTDLQVSLGLTYEALRNNFGITFEIIPTLAGPYARTGGLGFLTSERGLPQGR